MHDIMNAIEPHTPLGDADHVGLINAYNLQKINYELGGKDLYLCT